jgi:hypothetical protein
MPQRTINGFELRRLDKRLVKHKRLAGQVVDRFAANPTIAVCSDHARMQAVDHQANHIRSKQGALSHKTDLRWSPSSRLIVPLARRKWHWALLSAGFSSVVTIPSETTPFRRPVPVLSAGF